MHSTAKTVTEYLASLPSERRDVIAAVREMILASLPNGYEERMQYGMISYVVPLASFPAGYLGKKDVPLPYASLAAQKNHMAIYLMGAYGSNHVNRDLRAAFASAGKKLHMGKSCIRFRTLDDLPLAAIGKAVAAIPVKDFIAMYRNARTT